MQRLLTSHGDISFFFFFFCLCQSGRTLAQSLSLFPSVCLWQFNIYLTALFSLRQVRWKPLYPYLSSSASLPFVNVGGNRIFWHFANPYPYLSMSKMLARVDSLCHFPPLFSWLNARKITLPSCMKKRWTYLKVMWRTVVQKFVSNLLWLHTYILQMEYFSVISDWFQFIILTLSNYLLHIFKYVYLSVVI